MYIKRKIKFFLHKRKQGETQNLAILMRITMTGIKPFDFSLGHTIDLEHWDISNERAIEGAINKVNQTAADINRTIDEYKSIINEVFARYELIEKRIPQVGEVKDLFNNMIGKNKFDLPGQDNDFFKIFDLFTRVVGEENSWTDETHEKFDSIKRHLQKFDSNVSFYTLNDDKMRAYLNYLHNADMRNTSIAKNISFVKWFIRWASAKGYYDGKVHESFRPKLKGTDGNSKEVIHLTWDELMHLLTFEFPTHLPSLPLVRDVFCFLCFTSLRHSDVFKLKRSDVKKDHILVVTRKTADGIKIELNKYAKTILDKYADVKFKSDKVLPVTSLQTMNDNLKIMGEIAGINDMQRIVYFKRSRRIEEVYPKYALLTTHCGRRTFIVNSLYLGIPAEVVMKWTGHSDYKSMKPYIKIVDKLKEREMAKWDAM